MTAVEVTLPHAGGDIGATAAANALFAAATFASATAVTAAVAAAAFPEALRCPSADRERRGTFGVVLCTCTVRTVFSCMTREAMRCATFADLGVAAGFAAVDTFVVAVLLTVFR